MNKTTLKNYKLLLQKNPNTKYKILPYKFLIQITLKTTKTTQTITTTLTYSI